MVTQLNNDTIAAQASAPGRGGIAVIRVSGSKVQTICQGILGKTISPRTAHLLPFLDAENQILDQGIAIFFPNPNSFTGEDVLELQGHGGPVVVDMLLKRLLKLGARLAQPGEFSERAFLNGKIDLTQAEAIADLIDASSTQAAKLALRSLQGDFAKHINQLNQDIIYLRTYIEAAIDFTDEEIDFLSDAKIADQVQTIQRQLNDIQANAKQGSFLREGIQAVIIGQPNVGKSSLLNCLSGKDSAIVTDIPGTTRDVLREHILIDGIPMYIIDTAGLRESHDVVEQEGIKRAYQEMQKADIILYLQDASRDTAISHNIIHAPIIYVRNKIDLLNEIPQKKVEDNKITISLSAKANLGIDLLKQEIKQQIGYQDQSQGIFLARRRHLDALARAETYVKKAYQQLRHSAELAADDLRLAHLSLCEITGEFTADDLLGQIFSSFCIGK